MPIGRVVIPDRLFLFGNLQMKKNVVKQIMITQEKISVKYLGRKRCYLKRIFILWLLE